MPGRVLLWAMHKDRRGRKRKTWITRVLCGEKTKGLALGCAELKEEKRGGKGRALALRKLKDEQELRSSAEELRTERMEVAMTGSIKQSQ